MLHAVVLIAIGEVRKKPPAAAGRQFAYRDAAAKEAILGATLHFNARGVDFLFMLKSEEAEGTYSGSGTRTTYYLSYTLRVLPAAELRGGWVYVHSARSCIMLIWIFSLVLLHHHLAVFFFPRTMICKVKGAGEGVKTIGTRAAKMKRRLLKMLWHQTRVVFASERASKRERSLLFTLFSLHALKSYTSRQRARGSRVTTFLEQRLI